jgi:hypothetical protein
MYEVTFAYSFDLYKGKPKRDLEKLNGCIIKSYGVVKDSVTLCILVDSIETLNELKDLLKSKYKLNPKKTKKLK